jgi:hypothetical protein
MDGRNLEGVTGRVRSASKGAHLLLQMGGTKTLNRELAAAFRR